MKRGTMNRTVKVIFALSAVLLLVALSASLVDGVRAQSRQPSDDEVNAIAKKLYCPVCPNTPLDVCETQACKDWRDEIRTQLSVGWDEEQILSYFVERYGERVLAEPQRSGFTSLVWILPVVGTLLGFGIVAQALRTWRNHRQQELAADAAFAFESHSVTPEARQRIERELKELL